LIDTHCHLLGPGLREQLPRALDAARAAGVHAVITIGTTTGDSRASAEIASSHPDVWFSAGVHPLHSEDPRDWDDMLAAARHPRCVAWGELGLDRHYSQPPHAVQRAVLEEQLARILRWTADGLAKPVVVHCFTETPAEARQVLDFGAMISFTGVVTFRNAPEVAEAARLVPDDRIMCETDAPWLSPEPVRSEKPCTPAMVMHTARFLAALRRTPWDDFERTVDANARRFFGLPEGTGR